MRILIATVQVPFIRGGAECHAEGLREALVERGHEAEIVAIPFKSYPPDGVAKQMLACGLLDVTEVAGAPVDLLIGLRFPAYLIPHHRKVIWVLHQYRAAYELWDHPLTRMIHAPSGRSVRDFIHQVDTAALPAAKKLFANSRNVSKRLRQNCGIEAPHLYHPPPSASLYRSADALDYFFFPSRLCPPKRQILVLEALAECTLPCRVVFCGAPDNPTYAKTVADKAVGLGVADRVEWRGRISESEKVELYSKCLAVIYPPVDEDYGYVTLEAMLSAKPVITCNDSGGPLEFVTHLVTGLVVHPSPLAMASAMDTIWRNRKQARKLGDMGLRQYRELRISWESVVTALVS